MNVWFKLGEVVTRKATGEEHAITGITADTSYLCPVTGFGYNWSDHPGQVGYHLDELAYDEGQLVLFPQSALAKKQEPPEEGFTEEFTTLINFKTPIEA